MQLGDVLVASKGGLVANAGALSCSEQKPVRIERIVNIVAAVVCGGAGALVGVVFILLLLLTLVLPVFATVAVSASVFVSTAVVLWRKFVRPAHPGRARAGATIEI